MQRASLRQQGPAAVALASYKGSAHSVKLVAIGIAMANLNTDQLCLCAMCALCAVNLNAAPTRSPLSPIAIAFIWTIVRNVTLDWHTTLARSNCTASLPLEIHGKRASCKRTSEQQRKARFAIAICSAPLETLTNWDCAVCNCVSLCAIVSHSNV